MKPSVLAVLHNQRHRSLYESILRILERRGEISYGTIAEGNQEGAAKLNGQRLVITDATCLEDLEVFRDVQPDVGKVIVSLYDTNWVKGTYLHPYGGLLTMIEACEDELKRGQRKPEYGFPKGL
jgi:hypothetical protein